MALGIRLPCLFLDPTGGRGVDGEMFEFSLAKLIVLIGIVLAVWYGFKFVNRVQEIREAEAKRRARDERARGRVAPGSAEVEDTVKCRVCGAYVPMHGASDCGQTGCPYGH